MGRKKYKKQGESMLDILKRLLIYLGPFMKEIFFKNAELKEEVLKPTFILKALIVLGTVGAALAFLFGLTSTSLIDTHYSYRELSSDYSNLNKENQSLMLENRRLNSELTSAKEKIFLIELNKEELFSRTEECIKEKEKITSVCTCGPDTEKEIIRERRSINERLKGLDI